ncbi:hypothetical protein RhiTH_010272 [Rhizoctonia solani]
MHSETSTAFPARRDEKKSEDEAGELASSRISESDSLLQYNRTAGFVNKFTKNTEITSKPGLYPKLSQACDIVDKIYRRQIETRHRLKKLGWTDDIISGLHNNKELDRIWDEWVCRPKSPTDKDWTNIEQTLVSLLEEDIAARHERDRKRAIEEDLSEALNRLLTLISPPVKFSIQHPQSSMWEHTSPGPYLHCPPFPSFVHMGDWKIIRGLWKANCSKKEMRILLREQTHVIGAEIVAWKRGIESHFASLVYIKRGSRALNHIVQPTMLRFEGKTNPFEDYTDEHRMLLRGDILFYNINKDSLPPIPITYGDILQRGALVASPSSLRPRSLLFSPQESLNGYHFYLEAHVVAQALMESIHLPKASYHLMVGLGAEFRCKRCLDAHELTWLELVRHYIVASEAFKVDLKAFQIPGLKEVVAPEWAIFRHLVDVHGVAEPAVHLHHTPQDIQEPVYDFGGYGLPPYDLAFI